MKRHPWILAGSALSLLMASAPINAYPLQPQMHDSRSAALPVIRVQTNCPEGEDCAQGQPRKPQRDRNQGASAPKENERGGQRQKKQRESAPAGQQAPARKAEPQAEQPRNQRQKQAEQPAPAREQQQPAPARKDKPAARPAGAEEPAPARKAEPRAEQPKPRAQGQKQAEPARKPAQKQTQPKPQQPENGKPANATQPEPKPQTGQRPAPAGQTGNDQAEKPQSRQEKLREYMEKKKAGEQPAQRQPQKGQPAQQAQPGGAANQPRQPDQNKATQKPAANQANGRPARPVLPADTKPQALPKSRPGARPLPDNAASVTDSGKRGGDRQERGGKNEPGERPRNQPPQGRPGPLPQSDSAAQDRIRRVDRIESVEAEQGRRVDRDQWRDEWRKRRDDRRDQDGGTVVKEVNNRVIIKYGDNIYVDNRGINRRLERGARDSYGEELPNGFTRYTIVKDDGARVVTIRNAYGDIVRRSRIMPDNREVVLYYVPEDDYRDIREGYADAGADLPPLVLDIPADQYILDAQYAQPDDYYTYLDAPPVESVERIYSVDEVVHSARIRDKVRRIDLDTVTFDTGSADVGEDQVNKLQALGDAINRILKDNPAETFLIEGHTDAVGSDESNLVLSDERAQSVAEALTTVFDIPAENLTTQGYGEEYLKINTEGASRENRRVAVRRITPLVAPVASAQ